MSSSMGEKVKEARLLRQAAKAMFRFRAYLLTLDHLHIAGPMLTIFLVMTVTFVSITFVYPDTTDYISDAIRASGCHVFRPAQLLSEP